MKYPNMLLLCVVLCGARLFAAEAAQPSQGEKLVKQYAAIAEGHADIAYKKTDGKPEQTMLDLFLPLKKTDDQGRPLYPEGTPLAVYLHGGGWVGGSRSGGKGSLPYFMERGVALAQVDYRVAGTNGSTVETCVIDCFDAIRYLAKNAKQYGLDPNRIVVYGGSAGGHLTLMAVLADPDQFKGDPALADAKFKIVGGTALCPVATLVDKDAVGPTDYLVRANTDLVKLFGGPMEQTEALRKKLSPLYWLKKDSPRTIILHGENDGTVNIKGSVMMAEKAKEIGADLYLVREPDGGHNFQGKHRPPLWRVHRQIYLENLFDMIQFSCGKSTWTEL